MIWFCLLFHIFAIWAILSVFAWRARWKIVCHAAGLSSGASQAEMLERICELKEAAPDTEFGVSALLNNYSQPGNSGIGGRVLRPLNESEE